MSRQLAEYTRTMHDHRFTLNDLKWRNLLIDDQQTLYLIDCPNGDFWRSFWLKYRITKSLAAWIRWPNIAMSALAAPALLHAIPPTLASDGVG